MSELHTPAIQFQNIQTIKNGKPIIKNFNLTIFKGENWVFLGRNGAGKTTLINYICGYDWPTEGKISILGMDLGAVPTSLIQSKIGILQSEHQATALQKNLTVLELIITGIYHTIGFYKDPTPEIIQKAYDILNLYKLNELSERKFHTLSSGEKAKILLLRAIIDDPKILILDEPNANLDLKARIEFYETLSEVQKKIEASILITHRIEEIPPFYTHICLIKNGEVIASGKIKEVLNEKNLSILYDLSLEVVKKYLLLFQ